MTPPSGHAGAPDVERQADALIRRFSALSERVLSATGDPPSPLVAEMLEELSAAVEELEVITEEIHSQNKALAEAKKQLDVESAATVSCSIWAPTGTSSLTRSASSSSRTGQRPSCSGHRPLLSQKPVVVLVDAADSASRPRPSA